MLSYLLKCRGVNGLYWAFIMAGVSLSNLPPVINIILINGQCRDQWFVEPYKAVLLPPVMFL